MSFILNHSSCEVIRLKCSSLSHPRRTIWTGRIWPALTPATERKNQSWTCLSTFFAMDRWRMPAWCSPTGLCGPPRMGQWTASLPVVWQKCCNDSNVTLYLSVRRKLKKSSLVGLRGVTLLIEWWYLKGNFKRRGREVQEFDVKKFILSTCSQWGEEGIIERS